MIAARLGAQLQRPLASAELVRVFARRTDLKLVLDTAQLSALVLAGVRNGIWEYQDPVRGDAGWATQASPTTAVRIAEDTFIHPVGSRPATSEEDIEDLPPPPPPVPAGGFEQTGKTDVALTAARQAAADTGRTTVTAVAFRIDETGSGTAVELAKLLTVAPAGTPGAKISYDITVRADLGQPGDLAAVEFRGPAENYNHLKSAVDQVLRAHPAVVHATLTARFEPAIPLSGQEIENLRQRAADTGPARCHITLTTEDSP
jgi:hypothetical protein